jgi:hypothetical protein
MIRCNLFIPLIRVTLTLLALASTGCMTDPPQAITLPAWRQQVEQYVREQGNGDPTVLADLSWDDVHKGFAIIGDALPERSTDIIGWLVAHQLVGGKSCFLFLVGTVQRNNLEALCPIAMEWEGGNFRWTAGPSDPDALAAYRVRGIATMSEKVAQAPDPPAFPHGGETLEIHIEGAGVSIVDRDSGAEWNLVLEPAESRNTPGPVALVAKHGADPDANNLRRQKAHERP